MAAIANSSYSVFLNTTTKIECTLWIELNPKRQNSMKSTNPIQRVLFYMYRESC